jgi:DNA polymerase-2
MGLNGYILTRQWLETATGMDLVLWCHTESGPVQAIVKNQESVMFIMAQDVGTTNQILAAVDGWRHSQIKLKSFAHQPVFAYYFQSQGRLAEARKLLEQDGILPLEADIRPTDRYLMERFITGPVSIQGNFDKKKGFLQTINPALSPSILTAALAPSLKVVSLDIETSFTENILYSIAVQTDNESRVFMVGKGGSRLPYLEFADDERGVIVNFLDWMEITDPDLIIGWSVVNFDLDFLQRRCDALHIRFRLGRDAQSVKWRKSGTSANRLYALIPGRVALDGIEVLRTAFYRFESFSLENVSRELLGRGKLIEDVDDRAVEIQQLFRDDKDALASYNLADCELVRDIFKKTDLINFAVQRAALTGLDIDRSGGSVAAFDYLYLPRLHRKGFVAPRINEGEAVQASPGGYVLDSRPGLYENVIVLDFKSLYPSIIRTFNVDPLALCSAELEVESDPIPGYRGGKFSRHEYLLPTIIEELWSARDVARKENNGAMSQAIKIIMNSFYGVLGTTGCRFYDPRLVSSITLRGHEILQKTRDLIEEQGYSVIYGDTDSVFVWLRDFKGDSQVNEIGRALVTSLNRWWLDYLEETYALESCLELEFETHYLKFFMPTVRGSEQGSKKRYAGMVTSNKPGNKPELVFKGLESVRSDWSLLARKFQQELYQRIFNDDPYVEFIRSTVESVANGERDADLVLRKRLRRKLADYTRNVPPHVQAARKAEEIRSRKGLASRYRNGGWIEYVLTVNGPEPKQYLESPIDYDFYIERQLIPVADSILVFHQTSMGTLLDKQLGLF